MSRTLVALSAVLLALTLAFALGGCGASDASGETVATASAPTTVVVLSATTSTPPTEAATTTTTAATTTTTLETTTTTEAPTTTTEALVKVPSYKNFKGSYTGDDFGKALDSWEAAVKAGFKKAGLVAVVTLVAPGDPEYQKPKAGTMVKKGTTVHIHVAVYD